MNKEASAFLNACRIGAVYEDAGYVTPCLVWQAAYVTPYPRAFYKGVAVNRHRLMYMLHRPAENIKGKDVHHRCQNKSCIEITHLEALTPQEHCLRHIPLVTSRQVPDEVVVLMREALAEGISAKEILASLGDRWSEGTLRPILYGHRRKHVGVSTSEFRVAVG